MMCPRYENGGGVGGRREDILDAAARCFARRGYHEARTLEIAREAGVSEGTLYNYFGSKATLFEQVVADINHRVLTACREGSSGTSPARERLLRVAANLAGYFDAHRDHAVILSREPVSRGASAMWKELATGHVRTLGELLSSLLRDFGRRTSPAQEHALGVSFLGAIQLMLVQWCVDGHRGSMVPGPVHYAQSFISILEWGKVGEGQ